MFLLLTRRNTIIIARVQVVNPSLSLCLSTLFFWSTRFFVYVCLQLVAGDFIGIRNRLSASWRNEKPSRTTSLLCVFVGLSFFYFLELLVSGIVYRMQVSFDYKQFSLLKSLKTSCRCSTQEQWWNWKINFQKSRTIFWFLANWTPAPLNEWFI